MWTVKLQDWLEVPANAAPAWQAGILGLLRSEFVVACPLEGMVGQLQVASHLNNLTLQALFGYSSEAEAGKLTEIQHRLYRQLGLYTMAT
jgi:hypothetical protein